MELKRRSLLLLALCAAVLTSTEGAIPNCCVGHSKKMPWQLLVKVSSYEIQTKLGVCDIDAVILHFQGKKICAHPKVQKFLQKIKKKQNSRLA
ncbi:C-C motif chemokine 28-like isoform X2 [Myxocyprinus asiaticus]|uniref:C-C motif chemokine 28-like isoform X2 n=1 Tax=Myxocyprinus asiaticus TaxID=70543 RepID=UPI002221744E|nr:C-C motif chemokine 28-like isoform X2 [Myxocyprinus asiaticus]